MHFILDENVPESVRHVLESAGHTVDSIRDYVLPGSPDAVVATVSQELSAVLVTFDGDFKKIAPRVPTGARSRFKRLSRVWMRCNEYQAAQRVEKALALIESEYALAQSSASSAMHISIGNGYIRTER